MKVTDEVSLLKPCDENIDDETERAYNRAIVVIIKVNGIDQHFGLN
jgi:hypothetical protein